MKPPPKRAELKRIKFIKWDDVSRTKFLRKKLFINKSIIVYDYAFQKFMQQCKSIFTYLLRRFEWFPTLDQNTILCAHTSANHHSSRCCQAQCAWACNTQHGYCGEKSKFQNHFGFTWFRRLQMKSRYCRGKIVKQIHPWQHEITTAICL